VIGMLITHPSSGLPHIPDVLLGLTSVSAAGYVGKKAVTPTGVVTGSLKPDHGQAGTQIQIAVAALTPPSEPRAPMWVRFGDLSGAISAADVVGGATTLVSTAPQLLPPPKQPVNVSVITANGTFVDVGTFRYD